MTLVELKTLQPDGTYADPAELEAAAAEPQQPRPLRGSSTDAAAGVVGHAASTSTLRVDATTRPTR